MPELSPLHPVVYDKFGRAFGEPSRTVGKDRHWSLPPRCRVPVNVLVNGTSEHPVVWVFDPHDPEDGVQSYTVGSASQVDGIIKAITARAEIAGRSSPGEPADGCRTGQRRSL
jgi:hypothetical protein